MFQMLVLAAVHHDLCAFSLYLLPNSKGLGIQKAMDAFQSNICYK